MMRLKIFTWSHLSFISIIVVSEELNRLKCVFTKCWKWVFAILKYFVFKNKSCNRQYLTNEDKQGQWARKRQVAPSTNASRWFRHLQIQMRQESLFRETFNYQQVNTWLKMLAIVTIEVRASGLLFTWIVFKPSTNQPTVNIFSWGIRRLKRNK